MFDRNLWNTKRLLVEKQIKDLKILRDASGQPGWGQTKAWELESARRSATALYILRTCARTGKHVPSNWKESEISALIEKELPKYTLPDPAPHFVMDVPPEALKAMDEADEQAEVLREAHRREADEAAWYARSHARQ